MLKLYQLVGLALWAEAVLEAKSCPVTRVNQYEYSCGLNGTVQNPTYISQSQGVSSIETCAENCLGDPNCYAFRYVAGVGECDLYEHYLENMNFTTTETTTGQYNDRYCFSANCNEIAACEAVQHCEGVSPDGGSDQWTRYGCGYGLTSAFESKVSKLLINGSMSACLAARKCSNKPGLNGPFEVYYDLVGEQWVCLRDHAFPKFQYSGNLTLKENNVSYTTFTVQDSSVGASYGYWLSYVQD